jgi:hypothetical protein
LSTYPTVPVLRNSIANSKSCCPENIIRGLM